MSAWADPMPPRLVASLLDARDVRQVPLLRIAYSPGGATAGATPRSLRLERGLTVGRASDDLRAARACSGLGLCDPLVSLVHARIDPLPEGGWLIADAGSTEGTFVNGQRVSQVQLEPGDVIRTGESMLIFDEEDQMSAVRAAADQAALVPLPVLIEGETGVGKGVLARGIHAKSGRKGRFIDVNCATLKGELGDSKLFGHVRGAFTGADRDRKGLMAEAEGGTLFLDEFAELPEDMQVKVLQAVEHGIFTPLGSNRQVLADVRFIAATNADVSQQVHRGRLRVDLFARFDEPILRIPPLRERKGDLVEVLREMAAELDSELFDSLPITSLERLLLLSFPHNVRQLRHLVVRLKALSREAFEHYLAQQARHDLEQHRERIRERASAFPRQTSGVFRCARSNLASLLPASAPNPPASPANDSAVHAEKSSRSGTSGSPDRDTLDRLLEEEQGCVLKTARRAGISARHVYRLVRRYGLNLENYRRSRESRDLDNRFSTRTNGDAPCRPEKP